MSTHTDTTDRIRDLDPLDVPAFVAALWERAGWTVVDQADWDDTFLATDPDRDTSIVLRALTHADGHVSGEAIRDAARTRDHHGTDRVTVVSPLGFTTEALSIAEAHGVDAVGPDAVARLVGALDATDLLTSNR